MTKIIVDTNSLVHSIKNNLNYYRILEEKLGYVEFFMFKQSLKELEKININPKIKKLIKTIVKNDISIIDYMPDQTYVDDIIINFIKENNEYMVFTQDKGLIKRLDEQRIHTCFLSKNKTIIIK